MTVMERKQLAAEIAEAVKLYLFHTFDASAVVRSQILPIVERALGEARLEALEQAAKAIIKRSETYHPMSSVAIRVGRQMAELVRALKAAQHGEKELRKGK